MASVVELHSPLRPVIQGELPGLVADFTPGPLGLVQGEHRKLRVGIVGQALAEIAPAPLGRTSARESGGLRATWPGWLILTLYVAGSAWQRAMTCRDVE